MSGFVLIHRQILDDPDFRSHAEAMAFAWMVVKAAWKPVEVRYKGHVISLNRGDLSVSVRDMAEALDRSKDWASRFMGRLEKCGKIERKSCFQVRDNRTTERDRSATAPTVITICNYDKYQDVSERAATAPRQSLRQHRDSTATQNNEGNKGTRDNTNVLSSADAPVTPPAKPKKKSSAWVTIERPETVAAETWDEFEQHRKRKGAAITDTVIRAFEREAGKLGWSLEAAIIKSIERNWQGFEASWIRKENGNGTNNYQQPDTGTNDPVVQAIIAGKAERAGERQRQFGADAGGWTADGGDPTRFL